MSTTPYRVAGHAETHAPVTSKMGPSRPSCRTDRRHSSRCCEMSTVGQCPRHRAESPGTQRRTRPRCPRCRCCCSRCTCWTHRRRSSRRCKIRAAGQCPRRGTRSKGPQRHTSPACLRCMCCCSRCTCRARRRRSSRRCKMRTTGMCPRRRTRSRGTQRRASRHVQDADAAAVGAGVGRADVAARVAAR